MDGDGQDRERAMSVFSGLMLVQGPSELYALIWKQKIGHPELPASQLVLWEPTHGVRVMDRKRMSFVSVPRIYAGVETIKRAVCL